MVGIKQTFEVLQKAWNFLNNEKTRDFSSSPENWKSVDFRQKRALILFLREISGSCVEARHQRGKSRVERSISKTGLICLVLS